MRGFSRDNPPPVTVTGVAPWAVKPTPVGSTGSSTGSIHSTGVTHPLSGGSASTGGIPTTTMPKRTPLPFNPATTAVGSRSTTAAMLSNAPPNALTHTIQEVRLARQLAEQQQADQDDATAGSKDSSEGGEHTYQYIYIYCIYIYSVELMLYEHKSCILLSISLVLSIFSIILV